MNFIKVSVTVIIFATVIFAGVGWVKNIVKLTRTDFQAPYKAEILRGVGVIAAPMGAIEGYITISDR